MAELFTETKEKTIKMFTKYKFQADESLLEEVEAAQLCKRRLEHLKEGARAAGLPEEGGSEETKELWVDKRVDRMLVEHFLRAGFYE